MFLTTNRVETMDPAFESRIDVSIAFSSLTPALRAQIWINHLTKYVTSDDTFSKVAISSLAERELNGRQIKSAVKVALILAGSKGRALTLEDIRTVLQTRETQN
jgi:ATP-dependent 26S proteasome regulatory subunit